MYILTGRCYLMIFFVSYALLISNYFMYLNHTLAIHFVNRCQVMWERRVCELAHFLL